MASAALWIVIHWDINNSDYSYYTEQNGKDYSTAILNVQYQ